MRFHSFLVCMRNSINYLLFYVDYIDFFAMKPSDRITYHKINIYSTFVGRLTSWILIGIYASIFLKFGSDMIYRQNPQEISS